MKRMLSMALAATLAMSGTAFAAEGGSETGVKDKVEITVKGAYEAEHKAEEVVSVDVKWDAMNFVYADTSEGDWNPATHSYTGKSTEAGWVATTKTIEVVNHSNTQITASMTFEQDSAISGTLTGTFTENNGTANDGKLTLASAAEGEALGNYDKAPKASAEFGISGDAISDTESVKLGVITVEITKGDGSEAVLTGLADNKGAKFSSYEYDIACGSEPKWEYVKLLASYSDGSTKELTGTSAGVTLTPNSSTVDSSVSTGQYYYTAEYEGETCTICIMVSDSAHPGLPASADYLPLYDIQLNNE